MAPFSAVLFSRGWNVLKLKGLRANLTTPGDSDSHYVTSCATVRLYRLHRLLGVHLLTFCSLPLLTPHHISPSAVSLSLSLRCRSVHSWR